MADGRTCEVDERDGSDVEVTVEGAHASDEHDDVGEVEKHDAADALDQFHRSLRDRHEPGDHLAQERADATEDVSAQRSHREGGEEEDDHGDDDNHRPRGWIEGEVGLGARRNAEAQQQEQVHDEGGHLRYADTRAREGRMQSRLGEEAHIDRHRAQGRWGYEGGEVAGDLGEHRAVQRDALGDESGERPCCADVGHQSGDDGDGEPLEGSRGEQLAEIDLGELREQDVGGNGADDDHDERARLDPLDVDLLDLAVGADLHEGVAQVDHEVAVLAHGLARGRRQGHRLQHG